MSVARPRRPTTGRARARRGEGAQLRDEILAAADELLVETGDAGSVSIRAVADRVGVTPPSIYLHFADKSDLMFAVCERNFALLDEAMETSAARVPGPVEALVERGRAYVRFGLQHPEQYRILFMSPPWASPPRSQDPTVVGGASFQHLVEAVQRCIDAGKLHGDAVLASFTVWIAVHGVTSLLISKPDFPWPPLDQLVDHVLRAQLNGLATTTAHRARGRTSSTRRSVAGRVKKRSR